MLRNSVTLSKCGNEPVLSDIAENAHISNRKAYDTFMKFTKATHTEELIKDDFNSFAKLMCPPNRLYTYYYKKEAYKLDNDYYKLYSILSEFNIDFGTFPSCVFVGDIRLMLQLAFKNYCYYDLNKSSNSSIILDNDFTDIHYEQHNVKFTRTDIMESYIITMLSSMVKFDMFYGSKILESESSIREINILDYLWRLMYIAIAFTDRNGKAIIKCASTLTEETMLILDTLSLCFNSVHVCKPYASKIINDESYIVCIGRNDESIDYIPLNRPNIKSYKSSNAKLLADYEIALAETRLKYLTEVLEIMKNNPGLEFKKLIFSKDYIKYKHRYWDNLNSTVESAIKFRLRKKKSIDSTDISEFKTTSKIRKLIR